MVIKLKIIKSLERGEQICHIKRWYFRKDFCGGASTSAYQCEGASNEDGKGRSVQDMKVIGPGLPDLTVCSDHYHRFREDIRLFAEMGLKAYRFSIAWTRILPKGFGMINQSGVDHYREVISECRKYNIEPVVTMYHFDLPEDLQKEEDGLTLRASSGL